MSKELSLWNRLKHLNGYNPTRFVIKCFNALGAEKVLNDAFMQCKRLSSKVSKLCLQAIPHTLAARRHWNIVCWKSSLWLLVLPDFGKRIDDAANESDKDSRHTAKCNCGIEENQAGQSNGELIQSTDHRVRCRRSYADSPGGSIRDEEGGETRDDHRDDQGVASLRREVLSNVRGRPVFHEERSNEQDRNSEEVVVVHGYVHCQLRLKGRSVIVNILSKSLKLVSLIRFLIPRT